MVFDSRKILNFDGFNIAVSVMRSDQPPMVPVDPITFDVASSQDGFDDLGGVGIFLNQCFLCLITNDKGFVIAGFYSVVNGCIPQ